MVKVHFGRDLSTTMIATIAAGLIVMVVVGLTPLVAQAGPKFDHVIHISVDGLRPDFLQEVIDAGNAPTFARLQSEGAWTHNARTDFDYTITLPNHASMLTGRPVITPEGFPENTGHNHTENGDPTPRQTIHLGGGGRGGRGDVVYIASTFDVAHDNGMSTSMYASKTKFSLFSQTWDETNGRDDTIGDDNGTAKIDAVVINNSNEKAAVLINGDGGDVAGFVSDMTAQKFNYSFVHLRDPDSVGHANGWGGDEWKQSVSDVDGYLGDILAMIDDNEELRETTAVIITSDHGGEGTGHGTASITETYVIPFYVWGHGISAGDLYELNDATRVDPLEGRPDYIDDAAQPIRNGDSGNLALDLLGLDPIAGSIINADQSLRVVVPEPTTGAAGALGAAFVLGAHRPKRNR